MAVLQYDKTRLVEFGGHTELNRYWDHVLLIRMKFVQRKATCTTAKGKEVIADFK